MNEPNSAEKNGKPETSAWKDLLVNPLIIVAIVGGILTLLTAIASGFLTARDNREAELSRATFARQTARETLEADLIKKFVEGPRPENVRENLRFLVDSGLIPDYASGIQSYLVANPGSAPQVGSLSFLPSGEVVSDAVQQQLRETVSRFRTFLQSKGFSGLDESVSVFVYSKDSPAPAALSIPSNQPNSFYSKNTLYIHKDLSEDLSIALREFTHFALEKAVGTNMFQQTAIESALADYLPATYLKSPAIGLAFAKLTGPSAQGFRTLNNSQLYDANATRGPNGWFVRGIVWASALWSCRDPDRPEGVDNLLVSAWRKANVPPIDEEHVEARFGAALMAADLPLRACFSEQITKRGLPHE